MDVKGIEGIANLVGDARGEQCKRLDALAFDSFERFLSGLRGIMHDQRQTGTSGGLAIVDWLMSCRVLKRDMEAAHCYDVNGNPLRLSTMWNTSVNPLPPPPAWGVVRVYQGQAAVQEGGAGVTINYMGPDAGWYHDAFAFGWRVIPVGK